MSEIYEDVATLKEQMSAVYPQAIVENTDLNTLGVGIYYIPTISISATVLNKPVSATSNAAIIVLNGAGGGEIQQWYFINTKNTAANNKIYHRYFYDNSWSDWETGYLQQNDSGWLVLPLASGVSEHNHSSFPCRYRKIGNRVTIEGCVKGFSTIEKTICTIPAGYRPSKPFYLQCATNAGKTDTFYIQASGAVARVATTTPEASLSNTDYHFINMSYLID